MIRKSLFNFSLFGVLAMLAVWAITEPRHSGPLIDMPDLVEQSPMMGSWSGTLLTRTEWVKYPLRPQTREIKILSTYEVGADSELYSLKIIPDGPEGTPLTLWEQAIHDNQTLLRIRLPWKKDQVIGEDPSLERSEEILPFPGRSWANLRETYIQVEDFLRAGAKNINIQLVSNSPNGRLLVRAFQIESAGWHDLKPSETSGKPVEVEASPGTLLESIGTPAWPGRAAALNVVGPAGLTVEISPDLRSDQTEFRLRILKLTERGPESNEERSFTRDQMTTGGGVLVAVPISEGPATVFVEPLNFPARLQFRVDSLLLLEGRPVSEVVSRVEGKWADVRPITRVADLYDTYVENPEFPTSEVIIPVVSPKPGTPTTIYVDARIPMAADDEGPAEIQLFHSVVGDNGEVLSKGPLTAATFPSRKDFWFGAGPDGLRISQPIRFKVRFPKDARELRLWSANHVVVAAKVRAKPQQRVLFIPEQLPAMGLSRSETRDGHKDNPELWPVLPKDEHILRARDIVRAAALTSVLYEPARASEQLSWTQVIQSGFSITPISLGKRSVRVMVPVPVTRLDNRTFTGGENVFWPLNLDYSTPRDRSLP